MFARHLDTKQLLLISLAFIATIVSFFLCDTIALSLLLVFCVSATNMSFQSVCKSVLFSTLAGMAFVLLLYASGIIDGRVLRAINPLTGEEVSRNAFGFRHQNYLGKLAFAAFLAYIYLRMDKLKPIDVLVTAATFVFLYFFVNTKTASFLVLAALPIAFLVRNGNGLTFQRTLVAAFLLLQVGEIVAVCLFDSSNGLLATLNGLMSSRIAAAHTMLEGYPITPFGQDVAIVSSIDALRAGTGSATLDISFFNILLRNGVIILGFVVFAWASLVKKSLVEHDSALFIIVILLLFSCLFENWSVSLPACFMLAALLSKPNVSPSIGSFAKRVG